MRRRGLRPAYILPLLLALIPLCILIVYALFDYTIAENRFSLREQMRSKAFYLAEAGLNAAYYNFAAGNYYYTTHSADGTTPTNGFRLSPGCSVVHGGTYNGWVMWQWNPGDPVSASFTRSGLPESFMFRVFYPQSAPPPSLSATYAQEWRIDAVGKVGATSTQHALLGTTQSPFIYGIFSANQLSEFVRGEDQTINGDVHANGNLFIRPSSTTLTLQSNIVETAGFIYRYEDAWGRPDTGGTVQISKGNSTGPLTIMPGASQGLSGYGNEYDSFNQTWTSTVINKFGGVVMDQQVGGKAQVAAQLQSLLPGGFYDGAANLHITPTSTASYLSTVTFYNMAEQQNVTVKQIDVSALINSLDYPDTMRSLLIYADTPVRLVNAELFYKTVKGNTVYKPITLASDAPIYTKGSVNRVNNDGSISPDSSAWASGGDSLSSVLLMTTDRIYNLSYAFNDATGSSNGASPTQQVTWNGFTPAKGVKSDPNVSNLVLEVNCAWVDGAPVVSERNYATSNPTWPQDVNRWYNPIDLSSSGGCWPNSDSFLEDLSGITLRRLGSIMHMQNASMAHFDNHDAGEYTNAQGLLGWYTAWVVNTSYQPPTRVYSYDARLHTATANSPLAPMTGQRYMWLIVN